MGVRDGLAKHRLSMAQKEANGKQWYKDRIDGLDGRKRFTPVHGSTGMSEYTRMQINYDLFNGKLNKEDFAYVCNPLNLEGFELPAKMVNRDIVSGKIKALIGMEMRMPFIWRVFAVNPEATTRKEQELFTRMREVITQEIVSGLPGQQEGEKPQTPDEVRRYMEREHQDPAEVMAHQLLEYLSQQCDLRGKFSAGFKHLCISAREIYHVTIVNGEPVVWNVNPLQFNCDTSSGNHRIEDGEWATCEYFMTGSEIVRTFGDELTRAQIDELYRGERDDAPWNPYATMGIADDNFSDAEKHRVLHCVWKSLRRIKFLTYSDAEGEIQRTIVGETYRLNEAVGDISMEEQWLPEVYEGWKIGEDIYVRMRPVPGQFKDLDHVAHCKLPYYGVICDGMNSEPVSLMDRLKPYQYYYNIIMYRLELLIASDKGKKMLMNINAVPSDLGIDMKKWQYFFESTPFIWYNPNEEGAETAEGREVAKQIDLSLSSDIRQYVELAEYLRRQAGQVVGITDRIEGEVGNRETSSNYRQSLQQSGNILEPYFHLHAEAKRNVIEGLLEMAKVAYSTHRPQKLVYVLDDFSQRMIDLDQDLLDNSSYGIFVSDSFKLEETKETIQQLAHAALQNQQVELADVIAVLRQESSVEAEEILSSRIKQRAEEMQQAKQQEQEAMSQEEEKRREFEREKHKMRLEEIRVKEAERRTTETIKMSLTGASFNPDVDNNQDGRNDFVQLAMDNGLKTQELDQKRSLEEQKLAQRAESERQRLDLEREKLEVEREKIRAQRGKKGE